MADELISKYQINSARTKHMYMLSLTHLIDTQKYMYMYMYIEGSRTSYVPDSPPICITDKNDLKQ